MRNRKEGQVALMFLLIGYLILGTTMMWFIVSGISGEQVNYVQLPTYSYTNRTTHINFTSSVPSDLYETNEFYGIPPYWQYQALNGFVAKPLPFFPAVLLIKGITPVDGWIKNTYYVNNTVQQRFGVVIEAPSVVYGEIPYLEINDNGIDLVRGSDDFGTTYHYASSGYSSDTDLIVTTWYYTASHELDFFIDGEQLFSWTLPTFADTGVYYNNIYHGGIIGFEEFTTVSRIDTVSVITYNPKTDIASQSMNFATFIFELASFQAPAELFPPPFISILIPALFFYLPLLGILACIVNIMWPVV
jgi:hypothetical protein